MIIAVDAAGGDYAPYEVVKGALQAAEEYDVEIALVGKKDILHVLTSRPSKLPRRRTRKSRLTIVDASQVIDCHESPIKAIQSKPDSSIVVGINMVRQGKAAAFISAGHSGAVAVASFLSLGKIEGIPRPAIGSFINITPHNPVFLIDAGANVDCRPEHLVWFAYLGNLYVNQILGIASPRVGLLSNGEEETKGNKLVLETHQLLKKTDLNFIGNIEGHDIVKDAVDIIVTDGFVGNVVLKTLEGITDTWLYSLNQAGQVLAKAYRVPLQALHRDVGMEAWTKRLDYQEYGGACLLGVRGNVIISHGRSRARAIKNAIGLAKKTAEKDIAQKIEQRSRELAPILAEKVENGHVEVRV
ncbi:MAG: phosphate acyltransferase PlsX [Chloroflexi bacterium]|nr:phosphate acyltransferase PlsX [Chloroflexota bacterium]